MFPTFYQQKETEKGKTKKNIKVTDQRLREHTELAGKVKGICERRSHSMTQSLISNKCVINSRKVSEYAKKFGKF